MIRCVLVATDGSQAAQAAVQTAIELTQSLGPQARLHAVAAIDYADVPDILAKKPPDAPDLLSEQAAAALEAATALARSAGLELRTHTVRGEAVEAILDCAASIGADMLVAGAQGRNRLVRLVMGSVIGRLLRSTTLPVVVVAPQAGSPAARD